jgi:putative ABC transport system substrate-binding protein
MARRAFIATVTATILAAPLVGAAQQGTTPVIGFLSSVSLSVSEAFVTAFRQGLSETGYVEGQNVAIEYRWADGQYDRLPMQATDLLNRRVAAIAAAGPPAALAAKSATSTTPIIFVVGDAVPLGLVASLNRSALTSTIGSSINS